MNILQKLLIKRRSYKFLSVHTVVRGEEVVIAISGMLVVIGVFLQVLLRYVFHSPFLGIEEITLIVVSWFYLIGASYSVHEGIFIKAEVLPIFVKNQLLLKRLKVATTFLSIVAVAVLGYLAFVYFLWAAGARVTTMMLMWPINYSTAALVVGSGLMVLHLIIQMWREVKDISRPNLSMEKKSR